MLVTPPRNLDSPRGKCSPRRERPDVSLPEPSPRIAPEKRVQLGHRSHAPATFFEVRFASLFEARRRLFVSAITRLTGDTRSNPRIPARREPRLSSVRRVDLPCGRVHRACRRRAFDPVDPALVFPSSPPHRLSPARLAEDLTRAIPPGRPGKPGERREGRSTKRRTRHRDVGLSPHGLPSHGDGRQRFPSLARSGHPVVSGH